jgi:hypothetical protein
MNLLEFTVLFFINSRSRTQGAFLTKLYETLSELGFNLSVADLLIIIYNFGVRELLFEVGDNTIFEEVKSNNISNKERLFFISRNGEQYLKNTPDFESNLARLEELIDKNSII